MHEHPNITVVGLGYVGLPLALALAKHYPVLGVDIDAARVAALQNGHDATGEAGAEALRASSLRYATGMEGARDTDVFIVTVPTPVDKANLPDLRPVLSATRSVAQVLDGARRPIVVYESTVYPGVTEDLCGPELEKLTGLTRGRDFFLGYSPERINPGDKVHTVDKITKVVAGENREVLDALCAIYGRVTSGGTFPAASIKVAEAAKVIENAQRDINIAFMNEIAQIFRAMDFSVHDVLEAAGTKWNFLKFSPGLVGGHCIGVDPYYLSYKAQELGLKPDVVLAGRRINDTMAAWVADQVHGELLGPSDVLVLGVTFKEDVPDLRNSKVVDLVRRLQWLGHRVTVHDPQANPAECAHENAIALDADALSRRYDAVVMAVPHAQYRGMTPDAVAALLNPGGLAADIKGLWRGAAFPHGVRRWQL